MSAERRHPLFLIHANGILHAIPILRRLDLSQLLKFQDKAADRRVHAPNRRTLAPIIPRIGLYRLKYKAFSIIQDTLI